MSNTNWGSGSRVLSRPKEPPAGPAGGRGPQSGPGGRAPGSLPEESPAFVAQATGPLVVCLLVAIAAATFIAATPWLRAYQVARAPLILGLAAVLPVAICGALSRSLRMPALISYGGSLAGLVLMLAVTNSFNLSAVWDGLAHVPSQLLTETLPLSGSAYLLTAPVVLTWLCGALAAELSVRPTRPGATAALVPVLCFVFAFVLTTSAPVGNSVPEAAALLGDLMIWALVRHAIMERQRALVEAQAEGIHSRLSASLSRGAVGAALAIVLAAGLAVVVPGTLSVAGKAKTVSRATPVVSNVVVDPVDALASLRRYDPSAPAQTLFTVDVSGTWNGYVPVAELNTYDGDSWSFSATFQPTGGRVPLPGDAQVSGVQVVQRYELLRSIGLPFLPALDRAVQVRGISVDANATTGMLVASPKLPASYIVVSRVPGDTLDNLDATAPVASGNLVPGGDSPSYTALPDGSSRDIAEGVRFSATLTHAAASPTIGFLQNLAEELQAKERRVVPGPASASGKQSNTAALAGTSLAQVINAVTVDRTATPEQFATFYAVVARYLGVPARVVTGFRVPQASRQKPLAAGNYRLTDRETWTWVEIPVVGVGWVIVDPTPAATTTAASPPPESVRATPTTTPKQATALPATSNSGHEIAPPSKVHSHQPVHVNWALVLGIALPAAVIVAVLAGGLLVPAIRRRLRRVARHQPADPALLAAGAWLEFLDGLSRLGLDVSPSATSTEVADRVAERFGEEFGPPTHFVGAAADQALFSTAWPLEEARARSAWDSQRQLYKAMRRTLGFEAAAQTLVRVGSAPARPSQTKPRPPAEPAGESRSGAVR